jgi:hypothetical protein
MSDRIEEGEISDSEIKLLYGLEFLTTIERKGLARKQVGFAKGKFAVLKVHAYRCDITEIPIGNSLYDLFKSQAQNMKYDSLKEFLTRLETPLTDFEKMPF